MASDHNLLLCLFILPLLVAPLGGVSGSHVSIRASDMNSFPCSKMNNTCNASLYHINNGIPEDQVASFYSTNTSQMKPIHAKPQDYLITVPCTCKNVNGTTGYFYDTSYHVKQNDTFTDVSARFYSGQAWKIGGEEMYFIAGNVVTIHLLCGCVETDSQIVVTYTVQPNDTLSSVGTLLSAKTSDIENMNTTMAQNPDYIDVGRVLFVPMELNGNPPPSEVFSGSGRRHKWKMVIGILSTVIVLSVIT